MLKQCILFFSLGLAVNNGQLRPEISVIFWLCLNLLKVPKLLILKRYEFRQYILELKHSNEVCLKVSFKHVAVLQFCGHLFDKLIQIILVPF